MQKFIYLFTLIMLTSCATVKTKKIAVTPVGDWDYTLTGTPSGDYSGILSIIEKEKVLAATIKSSEGELPLTNVNFDKATSVITGNLNYQGTILALNATLSGESLAGTISSGGSEFPFKATRKAKV